MWSIENSNIQYGVNHICLLKDSPLLENIKIFLIVNNSKIEVSYIRLNQQIEFDINVKDNADYKIFIKEKNESFIFDLSLIIESKQIESVEINPILSYLKGVITLQLNISNIKSTHKIVIDGDINKTVEVNRLTSFHTFHHLINDYKVINFRINGIMYSKMVIDYEKFPNKLTKMSYGVRLNKTCNYDLTVSVDDNDFLISKGQTELPYNWENTKVFNIYVEGHFLFTQSLTKANYTPELILLPDPLRVKIGSPSLKNIEIRIKGQDRIFILEAGKTEMTIDLGFDEGYRTIEIEKVSNAIPVKNTFTFLIK